MEDVSEPVTILGAMAGLLIAIGGLIKVTPPLIEACKGLNCCYKKLSAPFGSMSNTTSLPPKLRLWNDRWGEKLYLDRHLDEKQIIVYTKDDNGGQLWNVEIVTDNQIRLWNDRWGEKLYLDRHINQKDIIAYIRDNRGGQLWNVEKINDKHIK